MSGTAQKAALVGGAQALGLSLSDGQVDQLLAYGALILKWNKVYNLTALRDPDAVLSHHLLDSLSVVAPLQRGLAQRGQGGTRLLDVGSGAGLPGVVIAIVCAQVDVSCLDAVAKKTAFVQQVAAELRLANLRSIHARVEVHAGAYDVISSRAFASLSDFYRGAAHLMTPDGVLLAMKGKQPDEEIAQLPASAEVFHVEQLHVPGLDAERCAVWIHRRPA